MVYGIHAGFRVNKIKIRVCEIPEAFCYTRLLTGL